MLQWWWNIYTNSTYREYSRFRHIKKRRNWESTCVNIDTPFPLGMECLMRQTVAWKRRCRFLRWPANQHTVAGLSAAKTGAGCDKNLAYARYTLSDVRINSYQCISAREGRCTPIAVFYIRPRAPPLLKFWFSQNFKRLEESVMGFNCAQEKAKFDREWLRLRKEYTDAGI